MLTFFFEPYSQAKAVSIISAFWLYFSGKLCFSSVKIEIKKRFSWESDDLKSKFKKIFKFCGTFLLHKKTITVACDKFIYLCKARLKLCVLLINIFGVDIPYYRKLSVHIDEENLRYTKLTSIFQKLGLHTWKWREIFENNLPLTLFYANLLRYKLMYLNEKT